MTKMTRVGRASIPGLAAILLLACATHAGAAEIARPNLLAAPWSKKPGGEQAGKLRAETRGGRTAGYLILGERSLRDGDWVAVRVGQRPNDRVGWVPEAKIHRVDVRYEIRISTSKRTMSLFREDERIWKTRVIIGTRATPTPRGVFAVHDFYRVSNDLRPWQIELTAHSEVLRTFQGGPGRVAIHGRQGALWAPLGTRRSNGCIRSPGWTLRSIRKLAPVGTPVIVS